MSLTEREREIVDLLRAEPLLDAAALAERTGSTKAAVSVHLSNLMRKGAVLGRGYLVRPEARSVVVVGGANMDIKAHSGHLVELRTSNPGTTVSTPGGVGRNIAENLARLGSPTHLVAPIGRDAFGEEVLAATRAAGVVVDHVVATTEATGTYLAVLDASGELVVAVSSMRATDGLTVAQLLRSRDLLAERVAADGGDEVGRTAQPREVLGDVAPHPTRRAGGRTRVGGVQLDRAARVRLDVHVGPADHNHGPGLGPHEVAPAEDRALAGEVGQVHGDGCPGRPRPLGQGSGVEQRLDPQEVDDLPLALGQSHT